MTLLERAAKAAWHQMHRDQISWEKQSSPVRDRWIACVKAAFDERDKAALMFAPDGSVVEVPNISVGEAEADTSLEVEAVTPEERANEINNVQWSDETELRALIAKAIRAAVAEERDACEKLALFVAMNFRKAGIGVGQGAAQNVANLIRKRSEV